MIDHENSSLLAIDSSSSWLRLAVGFASDRSVQSNEEVDRSHGQMIVRKIANLLDSSGTKISQIDGIIVCTGPGSFTGLRVGLAVGKGFAVALGVPMVGVNLFEVAKYRLGTDSVEIMVVIPHRRGEYYMTPLTGRSSGLDHVQVVAESALPELAREHKLIGVGSFDNGLVKSLEYNAADFLHLGRGKLAVGHADSIETLEPLYFGKSQAEINFEQRQQQK